MKIPIPCEFGTWQTGKYFFRQYSHEDKPKRISEQEYMSAYEEYRNY